MTEEYQMPKEEGIDHSLGLLKEGYHFISNRSKGLQTDVFETRLLGMKVICMGGKEAAEIFYDDKKFQRQHAAPNRVVQTLFGKGGVQALDGKEHRHRKEMFMSVMTQERLGELARITGHQWELALNRWTQVKQVVFYEEVQEILSRAACEWAGVHVEEDDIKETTKNLAAMFESAATAGPKHWVGRNARNQVEKWMTELVENIRNGKVKPQEDTILHRFTWHRDLEGNLLSPETVAVEIINILRPIVAIAIYINFIVLALHENPEVTTKLRSGNDRFIQMFIHEIRRFYPFFPFVAALVKKDFTWRGYDFEKGTLTLLDLYGTNHDTKIWDNPEHFSPERFDKREESLYDFIPQGGGKYLEGHRCAGEQATIEIMKVSLDYVVNKMEYHLPNQDLHFSMTSMPSIPNSKIILENIRRK
ncbi:cytochrome P450 [Fredinandcohnia humi]